jgi:GMP synthase (glutamine-hydrolysing)
MQHETLLVVDFGSQVTRLIARRVREQGVFTEIVPHTKANARLDELGPSVRGIVLSGGPSSIDEPGAPELPAGILERGVPVLGICYGLYLMVHATGGEVVHSSER